MRGLTCESGRYVALFLPLSPIRPLLSLANASQLPRRGSFFRERLLRSHVTTAFFVCQPNIFDGLQSEQTKTAPDIRGGKSYFLAAEAADLAKNLPDGAEIEPHHTSLPVEILSREDGSIVTYL